MDHQIIRSRPSRDRMIQTTTATTMYAKELQVQQDNGLFLKPEKYNFEEEEIDDLRLRVEEEQFSMTAK